MLKHHQLHTQASNIILKEFQFMTLKIFSSKKIKKKIMLKNLALTLLIFFHEFLFIMAILGKVVFQLNQNCYKINIIKTNRPGQSL